MNEPRQQGGSTGKQPVHLKVLPQGHQIRLDRSQAIQVNVEASRKTELPAAADSNASIGIESYAPTSRVSASSRPVPALHPNPGRWLHMSSSTRARGSFSTSVAAGTSHAVRRMQARSHSWADPGRWRAGPI